MSNSPRSELLGNQQPRIDVRPKFFNEDRAEAAIRFSSRLGLTPMEWQERVLRSFLASNKEGKWSANMWGLSVPRQNGKNAVIEMVELFLMIGMDYRILHTAHEVKTAREAFNRIASFFDEEKFPELHDLVVKNGIRRTNGQEGIELKSGAGIKFSARTLGAGRGFTNDCMVFDEAQQLSDDSLAALTPTNSAAPHGDPVYLFTGTPPSPLMDGSAWKRIRQEAIGGKSSSLAYQEWSCDGKVDLDDLKNVAAANPSFGIRLSTRAIAAERSLMDDVTYARERLGMWDSDEDLRVISQALWESRATSSPPTTGGVVVFALDASPNLEYVSIVAARKVGDATHVELIEHGSAKTGTQWVLDFFADPKRRRNELVIDFYCPLSFLAPDLQKMGVKVTIPKVDVVAADCAAFVNAVNESRMTHFDQIQLNKAVAGASKRTVRETLWMWNRKTHDVDITPLVAATLAHGHAQRVRVASTAGPRRIY